MSDYIHPLIAGIVRELPKQGVPMTHRRRQEWMRAFHGILNLLYPEPESEKDSAPSVFTVAPLATQGALSDAPVMQTPAADGAVHG